MSIQIEQTDVPFAKLSNPGMSLLVLSSLLAPEFLHKKKEILEKIEQEMPNIQPYFLPPYSPDFNLAELVWHSAK